MVNDVLILSNVPVYIGPCRVDYVVCQNQIKFYLVTHNIQYVHFNKSDMTEDIL